MKKWMAVFLCLTLLFSCLPGCSQEEDPYIPTGDGLSDQVGVKPNPTLPNQGEKPQVGLAYYPDRSLNPFAATDSTNRVLFSLIYQGLFTLDRDYKVHPILCKKYNVSADMKTYTFYIEKALFSDGTSLTAEDVRASLEAARVSSWYKGRLQHIREVSCYGDAVMVELNIPMSNLPALMDFPIVKASQVDADTPLGTGPYRLDGSQLRRQAAWWCNAKLPTDADTIALVEATSPAQIRDNFTFGKVSLVSTNPGGRDYVDFHSDYELWSCENGIFLYLACNEKSQVFSDPALRRALTYAIDRSLLVEDYYRGFAQAACLPASPQSPYYDRILAAKYDYDPDIFREAVALIPEPKPSEDGKAPAPVSVTILVNKADSRRVRVARAIAQMLIDCGLNATTSELSGDSYTRALTRGNYDLHLGQTTLSPNMDLSAFYAGNGALNFGGLADSAIYTMSQKALENSGNYYTLHKLVMDDGMLCPILFRSYAIYTTRGVFGQLDAVRDNLFFYTLGKTIDDVYTP